MRRLGVASEPFLPKACTDQEKPQPSHKAQLEGKMPRNSFP